MSEKRIPTGTTATMILISMLFIMIFSPLTQTAKPFQTCPAGQFVFGENNDYTAKCATPAGTNQEASSACALNQYTISEAITGILTCAQVDISQITGNIVNSITQGAHTFVGSIGLVNTTSIVWNFNNGANSIKGLLGNMNCAANTWVSSVTGNVLTCTQPSLTSLSDYIPPKRVTSNQQPSSAQATIVQSKGAQATSGTSNPVTFTSPVTATNLLIACAGVSSAIAINAPTDTFGNLWTFIATKANTATVNCYYAGALQTGTETITFNTGGACVNCGFAIFELSGAMGLGILNAVCSTCTGTTDVTTSLTFIQHPIFISCLASTTSQGTFTHGTNFVTLATGNLDINCQTSTSGITSPTTFPATTSNSVTFAYLGIAVQATSSTTLTASLTANTNYVFQANIYITGGTLSTGNFAIHTIADSTNNLALQLVCGGQFGVTTTNSNCIVTQGMDTLIFPTSISQNNFIIITGSITMGASNGVLQIDFANISQASSAAPTIQSGSFMTIQKSN
jgi:hypothetical protein